MKLLLIGPIIGWTFLIPKSCSEPKNDDYCWQCKATQGVNKDIQEFGCESSSLKQEKKINTFTKKHKNTYKVTCLKEKLYK